MRIDIMTLFPESVGDMLCESILGRAEERGYIRIECHQIRDYTLNKQKQEAYLRRSRRAAPYHLFFPLRRNFPSGHSQAPGRRL